jgi:hypothetical protein
MCPAFADGPISMTGTSIELGATLTRADVPGLCAALADRLRGGGPGVVTCDVTRARADVVAVEALTRLHLSARRHGRRLVVSGAGPPLLELIALMGLTVLSIEPGRQAEQREEPGGVEEVVDARDPPG